MTPTWRSVIEKLQNVYILLTTSKICTHNLSQQNTMGGWGFDKRICRGNSEGFVHPPNFLESEVMFPSRYDELGIFCANCQSLRCAAVLLPLTCLSESQPEIGCNKIHQPCERMLWNRH